MVLFTQFLNRRNGGCPVSKWTERHCPMVSFQVEAYVGLKKSPRKGAG